MYTLIVFLQERTLRCFCSECVSFGSSYRKHGCGFILVFRTRKIHVYPYMFLLAHTLSCFCSLCVSFIYIESMVVVSYS